MREKQPIIDSAERTFSVFIMKRPSVWSNLGLNLLWHGLAILEVFLILRFLGATISMDSAFLLEGLTNVIDAIGVSNPGNFEPTKLGICSSQNYLA